MSHLEEMNELELLRTHGAVIDELQGRGVVRTVSYELSQDCTFNSPSQAAAMMGRNANGEAALRETLEAMLRGEAAIHGGALWLLGDKVYGKTDLLVRCDEHASDLGNYHYRVKEVKNATKVEATFSPGQGKPGTVRQQSQPTHSAP